MRDFNKMKRQNNWFFNFVFTVIVIVFVGIISFYGVAAYFAVKAVKSLDSSTPQAAGEVIGKFLKGIEDGKK